jgi:mono/diheme cytochrome c family protein/plastocyanin
MGSWRRILVSLVVAALAVGATACGSSEEPDLENGKRLFTGEGIKRKGYQPCGACHALARANTTNTAGPDLDEAFATARRDGMNEETFQGIIHDQIDAPRKNSSMPADLVTGDDARDVAAYIASVAGEPGDDRGRLAAIGRPQNTKPIPAEGGVLTMPADESGATRFASTNATAEAGSLEIVMPNPSGSPHNIALAGGEAGQVVGQGGESRIEVNLKPGEYEYLCTVPGHADGGMKGTLKVE